MQNEAQSGFKETEVCRTGELSARVALRYLLLSMHPVLYGLCHPGLILFSPFPPSAHPHGPSFPASPPTRVPVPTRLAGPPAGLPKEQLPCPARRPPSLPRAPGRSGLCQPASLLGFFSLHSLQKEVSSKKPAGGSGAASARAAGGSAWGPLAAFTPQPCSLPFPATPGPCFGAATTVTSSRGCLKWLF